jgi:O-succinylbenzoic acid--CoA ligase
MAEAVRRFGDQEAIVSREHSMTYSEFSAATVATAAGLADHSLTAHDHVAVIAEPCWRYPVLLQAIWSLGAVAVPISHRFPPSMIERLGAETGCGLVVHDSSFQPPTTSQTIRPLAIENIVRPSPDNVTIPEPREVPESDSPATILFTSGSSGTPKGVVHTLAHHLESARASNANIELSPGDRWLVGLPFHHVAGLAIMFRTLLAGAAMVIPESHTNLSQTIDEFGVTHLSLVAVQLDRLMKSGLTRPAEVRLKAILVGGSAIPPDLIRDAHQRGWPIFTTYGSTEMASQITTTRPSDKLPQLLSSGRPLGHSEIRLNDAGEILVRGNSLARGYLVGGEIEPVADGEGWFHTGDLGEIDDNGCLTVRGRRDRMFISGGENIHPETIELAVARLPGIVRVCVFGAEDAEYGYRPIAVVDFGDEEPAREEELRAQLRNESLPGLMVPDRFYLWPERPETGIVKTDLKTIMACWRRGDLVRLT